MQARARLLASALLLGGFIIQFDHYAIGATDEDLPRLATPNLAGIERHPLGLEPPLHAIQIPARQGNIVHHAGIGLLLLASRPNPPPIPHPPAHPLHPP